MPAYRAVLFDWMPTLADPPPPATMVRRTAAVLGRDMSAWYSMLGEHVALRWPIRGCREQCG